jgi:pilus assembly protein CpaB
MNLRGLLVLLVSLALAGVAAISANRWMSSQLAVAETDMVEVIAAAADIPFGTTLDATHIKRIQLPPGSAPEKSFNDPQQVIGRIASTPLYKGEVLVDGRVSEHLGGSALAAAIPEGKRAITVGVDAVVGVAGFLLPGNRVDLLTTQDGRTRTVIENLKVLAVDQTASSNKTDPVLVRAVTLEVTPAQAEEIATLGGSVRFTLRNPLDELLAEVVPTEPEPQPERQIGQLAETPRPPEPLATPPQNTSEIVVIKRINPEIWRPSSQPPYLWERK